MKPLPYERYVITDYELMKAAALWRVGYDTHDIARKLRVHESAIYNRLNVIRGAKRG